MVELARNARGLTQKELALKLNISQGNLSKITNKLISESGIDLLDGLVSILGFPESFFLQVAEAYPPDLLYRRKITISQKALYNIEAWINIYRISIQKLIKDVEFPEYRIPSFNLETEDSPESVAQLTRQHLRIPNGPINNLIKLVEDAGVLVIKYDFDADKIDGLSIHTDYKTPIIFINNSFSSDRQRFTLAHEIGHLVLHFQKDLDGTRDIENEANRFASEFLMPRKDIAPQFNSSNISISYLGTLKKYWKVSMASLLYKAKELGYLDAGQTKYLYYLFSGYRKKEPKEFDIPFEWPTLINELTEIYLTDLGYTKEELSESLFLPVKEFDRIFAKNFQLRIV